MALISSVKLAGAESQDARRCVTGQWVDHSGVMFAEPGVMTAPSSPPRSATPDRHIRTMGRGWLLSDAILPARNAIMQSDVNQRAKDVVTAASGNVQGSSRLAAAPLALRIVEVEQLGPALRIWPPPRLLLDVAELDCVEQQHWEDHLNRALRVCGCAEGTVGMLMAVLACVCSYVGGAAWLPRTGWAMAVAVLGSVIAGALTGKTVGVLRGRWRARRLAGALTRLVVQRRAGQTLIASL